MRKIVRAQGGEDVLPAVGRTAGVTGLQADAGQRNIYGEGVTVRSRRFAVAGGRSRRIERLQGKDVGPKRSFF